MKPPVNKIEFWKDRIDNAVSEHYSVYIANEVLWKNIFASHKRIISELITPEDKVLDAGCGYGRMCKLFIPQQYLGVDFSPDFIRLSEEKYPDYKFQLANLKKLPFKDNEFDWAFCVSIRNMIIDYESKKAWEKIEKELKRVSKKVLILEYTDYEKYEII